MTLCSTEERILETAVERFAAKGYAATTIAEICEGAQANIAAINYHFGSKERLFKAALHRAFQVAEKSYPIDSQSRPSSAPEQRLRSFMSAIIHRSLDSGPAGSFHRILRHEATTDAGNHAMVAQEIYSLQGAPLERILAEMLGQNDPDLLFQARLNVAALCIFPSIATPIRQQLFSDPPRANELEAHIDRQWNFALAGLAQLSTSSVLSLPHSHPCAPYSP